MSNIISCLTYAKITSTFGSFKKKENLTPDCFGVRIPRKNHFNHFVIFPSNFPKEVVRGWAIAKLHG